MSILDDTTTFERPIIRKAEKANRKKKASEKDVGKYLVKKMKCIEELQEPKKRKSSRQSGNGSLGRVEG